MNGPPACQVCGATKVWREAGVNRQGQPYEAFWSCPNYKNHPPKREQGSNQPQGQYGPPQGFAPPPQSPPQGQTAPRPAQGSSPAPDARERSIAAQTCVRGACDVAAGVTWATPADAEAFAVRLANRLFWDVVCPAIAGNRMADTRPPFQDEPDWAPIG